MEAMNNADRDVLRLFDDYFPQMCADLGLSVGAGDSRDLVWLGCSYVFRAVDNCVVVLAQDLPCARCPVHPWQRDKYMF